MSESKGNIITFYSYKGGTGRTMTLANVAWILASHGYKVLVIDWDLEAPGLHRFYYPFLIDHNLSSSEGIIDFFWRINRYKDFVNADLSDDFLSELSIRLDWEFPQNGFIDFIPSGKQDTMYSTKVNSFDWETLYTNGLGPKIIPDLIGCFKSQYDYILIDSRTGVSDTAGICTVQFPDSLLIFSTLNNQNLLGSKAIAESVTRQDSSIRVLPVLTRVDSFEHNKLSLGRNLARRLFSPILNKVGIDNQEEYWRNQEIPYIPYYSYEEILSVFADDTGVHNSLLSSMERISSLVTNGIVTKQRQLSTEKKQFVIDQYESASDRLIKNEEAVYSGNSGVKKQKSTQIRTEPRFDPVHVERLLSDSGSWNEWRKQNPTTRPNLSDAYLSGLSFTSYDFRGVDLSFANLYGTELTDSDFAGANLSHANLGSCNLSYANFEKANLYETNFRSSNLTEANLSEAILVEADFNGSNLSKVDLSYAILKNTFFGSTQFGNTNFDNTIGLETCIHEGPSELGYQPLNRTGDLPLAFLRGCGLRDYQIEYHKLDSPDLSNAEINDIIYRIYDLRAHQAVQISPLFISYNHMDSDFVDFLEAGLIDKGIRFWRDIHEVKAGRLERQVDRAMRLNPTILLILSENSVNSNWVEHEVESARELSRELERDVLCPIALDDSWKDASWPRYITRWISVYNVLDFGQWKNDEVFKRQFTRLLDGLEILYN